MIYIILYRKLDLNLNPICYYYIEYRIIGRYDVMFLQICTVDWCLQIKNKPHTLKKGFKFILLQ